MSDPMTIHDDTTQVERDRVRDLQRQARRKLFLESVPSAYATATYADLPTPPTIAEAVVAWLGGASPALVLTGTAEDTLRAAYAVLRDADGRGLWAVGRDAHQLLVELAAGRPRSAGARLVEQCDVALVASLPPQVGVPKSARRDLLDLLDTRLRQRRRTVLTTSLTPSKLAEFLGPDLSSQLATLATFVDLSDAGGRRE